MSRRLRLCFVDVRVTFESSTYSYAEDHGVVTDIRVRLSNQIAQDLTVSVRGGQ